MRFAFALLLFTLGSPALGAPPIDFEKKIWPILEARCIQCHGAPKRTASGRLKKPKGGVRLDSVQAIRESQDGEVLVPGRPASSLLFERIALAADDDDIMPPAKEGKPLARKEVALIRTWIAQGANFGDWKGRALDGNVASSDVKTTKSAILPPVTSLAFAPDGRSLVACSQAGVHVYGWPGLGLQERITAMAPNLHDLAFSADGDRLAVGGGNPSRDGAVEIFSWPERKSLRTIKAHEDSVKTGVWRDHGTLASASLDNSIALWSVESGSLIRRFTGHSRGVTALCFLKDKKTLVSAGIDQSLRVWDVDSGELIRSLHQHTKPVHALALRPAEGGLPMVASAAGDRSVRFWQPTIGRMIRYARLEAEPLDIAWLNDGSRIVVACRDGHVRVVDPDTVEVTQDLPAIDGWAYSLAVHPTDGSVVVGGVNGQVRRVLPVLAK